MSDPRWLTMARSYVGLREVAGRKHNPQILKWWVAIRAPFTDDETPWCAGFVGGILEACGIKSSRSAAARSYRNWGVALKKPKTGCIVVFERGPRNGHVGFFVGFDTRGNLLILGGNQGDAVNIRAFPKSRVLAYRWPMGEDTPVEDAPVFNEHAPLSQGEGLIWQSDDPDGEEGEEPRKTFWEKAQGWLAGIGGGGLVTGGLFDWRVAAVFGVVGLIVFFVLLYKGRI